MRSRIRQILSDQARLPRGLDAVADDDDLYAAGMTSHASVSVMLGLEDEFDVEFPDSLLRKETFESIAAIERALGTLVEAPTLPAAGAR
jgi:acyl carrier protein